ncbi:MAG: ATP-binding cassette domain-containing protein, partial [bacterium]
EMLLREVGLWDRRTHRPGELSIGEQQRVAIARALINRPALLLADEPTASLDAANVTTVLDLIFKLCGENDTTLVTVSHDTSIASRFSRTVNAGNWLHSREVSHV